MPTVPDIDLARIREGETLMSEIVRTADGMFAMDDGEIMDMLCTGPASDIKDTVRAMIDAGTFREVLQEAEMELLSRIEGGSK